MSLAAGSRVHSSGEYATYSQKLHCNYTCSRNMCRSRTICGDIQAKFRVDKKELQKILGSSSKIKFRDNYLINCFISFHYVDDNRFASVPNISINCTDGSAWIHITHPCYSLEPMIFCRPCGAFVSSVTLNNLLKKCVASNLELALFTSAKLSPSMCVKENHHFFYEMPGSDVTLCSELRISSIDDEGTLSYSLLCDSDGNLLNGIKVSKLCEQPYFILDTHLLALSFRNILRFPRISSRLRSASRILNGSNLSFISDKLSRKMFLTICVTDTRTVAVYYIPVKIPETAHASFFLKSNFHLRAETSEQIYNFISTAMLHSDTSNFSSACTRIHMNDCALQIDLENSHIICPISMDSFPTLHEMFTSNFLKSKKCEYIIVDRSRIERALAQIMVLNDGESAELQYVYEFKGSQIDNQMNSILNFRVNSRNSKVSASMNVARADGQCPLLTSMSICGNIDVKSMYWSLSNFSKESVSLMLVSDAIQSSNACTLLLDYIIVSDGITHISIEGHLQSSVKILLTSTRS